MHRFAYPCVQLFFHRALVKCQSVFFVNSLNYFCAAYGGGMEIIMNELQRGTLEARFADIIWECEPISSTDLSRKAEELLGWKKSTSFTVLKRLCDKGIFRNDKGTVTSVYKRDEFDSMQSERFVEENFSGSLPAFFAAFTQRKGLSKKDIGELRRMIDSYTEE